LEENSFSPWYRDLWFTVGMEIVFKNLRKLTSTKNQESNGEYFLTSKQNPAKSNAVSLTNKTRWNFSHTRVPV